MSGSFLLQGSRNVPPAADGCADLIFIRQVIVLLRNMPVIVSFEAGLH